MGGGGPKTCFHANFHCYINFMLFCAKILGGGKSITEVGKQLEEVPRHSVEESQWTALFGMKYYANSSARLKRKMSRNICGKISIMQGKSLSGVGKQLEEATPPPPPHPVDESQQTSLFKMKYYENSSIRPKRKSGSKRMRLDFNAEKFHSCGKNSLNKTK